MKHETERLILREWQNSDKEPFFLMNKNTQVMEFLPHALSREESDALIDRIQEGFAKHGFGWWAVELKKTKEFIGFVGLGIPRFETFFTPCVEIGWRLMPSFWGKGYATEAAKQALTIGFQLHDLQEIVSFTVPKNLRSRSVMERLGMGRNPSEDFEHPVLAEGHPLSQHVLYRLTKSQWSQREGIHRQ